MKKIMFILIIIFLFVVSSFPVNAQNFSKQQADFSLRYNGLKIPFQTFSLFVLPREGIEIYIAEEDRNQPYLIELGGKTFESGTSFKWQAPAESGYYPVTIKKKNSKQRSSKIKLNVFVIHPRSEKQGEYMHGFKLGYYPTIPENKKKHYKKPDGFLKITEALLDINLTPHFKMEQFLTNQSTELPQFIAIQESLLLKLEYFLEEVNNSGYYAETFGIVSFYRSPYFNKKLGNGTGLSRHIFGDAADIYIDNSGNEWMDDLNGDEESTKADADILFNLAKKFDQKNKISDLQGGLSSYKGNGVRGPFLHMDARGFHVTW